MNLKTLCRSFWFGGMYLLSKAFLEPKGSGYLAGKHILFSQGNNSHCQSFTEPWICWSIWGSNDDGEESWKCLLIPLSFFFSLSLLLSLHIGSYLVFWGRGRKGLSLTCSVFGSSCLINHHVYVHHSWDTAGVVPKEIEEKGRGFFLALPDHCSLLISYV